MTARLVDPQPSQQAPVLHYTSSKPLTRWWWFACDIHPFDLSTQLEWLKDNGFGGVEIAWIFPPRGSDPWGRAFPKMTPEEKAARARAPAWLSKEWVALVVHAKTEADRLGLSCDFTFGTLWPFGDTLVTPEDASVTIIGDRNFELQRLRYSWEQPAEGYVIDHLNRAAFERYADRVGGALSPALKGKQSGLFCDSWEVHAKTLWNDGFQERFKKRFSYDIFPLIPTFWQTDDGDVRYDYLSLVSELVIEQFYKPFVERSRQLGCFLRVQIAGAPVDPIQAYSLIDVPETEAMLFEAPFGRVVASAAAIAHRAEVSSETFTCIYGFPDKVDPLKHQFEEHVADLKLVADALFANGVNQIVWHGTPFTPADAEHDFAFYATVHVGREGALARHLNPFNAYMAAVSSTMKQGRTYSDIALWLPLEDGWVTRDFQDVPGSQGAWELRYVYAPEETRGHHPLWVTNAILMGARVVDGRLIVGGATFRALYIDVQFLAVEGLETILRFAKEGLPIVLKQDPRQPGRNKRSNYADLLAELRTKAFATLDEAVSWPALVSSDDGETLPDFWARVDGETTIIFFADPRAQGLKLPLAYGQSYSTQTLERRITISTGQAKHTVTLSFPPNASRLLKVDADGAKLVDLAYVPPPAQPNKP